MGNEKADFYYKRYSLYEFYLKLLCLLGKVRRPPKSAADCKRMIMQGIIILTTITMFFFYLYYVGGRRGFMPHNSQFLIGIALSSYFTIRKKEIRNILLTLAILLIFIYKSWIGFACIAVTYLAVYWRNKKMRNMLIVFFIIALNLIPMIFLRWRYIKTDWKKRAKIYELTLNHWNNKIWGEGYQSFSKLSVNQPENRSDKLWLHTAHSDFLQGLFEFGIIGMLPILVLFILPLFFVDMSTLMNRAIFGGYFCLLFQALVDFPFHRAITGHLGLVIMSLVYLTILEKRRALWR